MRTSSAWIRPAAAATLAAGRCRRLGASLFWANLNKGKRSVTIDHRSDEGRELLMELVVGSGHDGGVFIDNLVGARRLRYEQLAARRRDVIHVHVEGRRNGKPAVDYSINAEVGVPLMTGPADASVPVNHVLPAGTSLPAC